MRRVFIILALLPLCAHAQKNFLVGGRRSTESMMHSQATRSSTQQTRQAEMPAPCFVDTLFTPTVPFTSRAVSMHGYSKRLNDGDESFLLRNETQRYRISRVVLMLVYTTESGVELHRRQETVECNLYPGSAQVVTIKSFDKNNNFYYYSTPPQRAKGTPYRVRYDVLRYDVVVE